MTEVITNVVAQNQIKRALEDIILDLLQHSDCVALVGVRQVGKTTLAHMVKARYPEVVYLNLESQDDLHSLDKPEDFFRQNSHKLVILDEIQTCPELFSILKSQIDERRRTLGEVRGRFLILGSASEELLRQAVALTGRFSRINLGGFHPLELSDDLARRSGAVIDVASILDTNDGESTLQGRSDGIDLNRLWVRGGLPPSYLAESDERSLRWRRDFLESYIDRDLKALGYNIDSVAFKRFWEFLSRNQGSLWDASKCAKGLKTKVGLVRECLSILQRLEFVRELRPWYRNMGKQLTKAEKYFVRDSGLLHAILNLGTLDEIISAGIAGPSWEGFVIESLIGSANQAKDFFFYRDTNKAELDLIIELSSDRRWAYEIRRSDEPRAKRGNITAAETVHAEKRLLVYPGTETYSVNGGFVVTPLLQACREISIA